MIVIDVGCGRYGGDYSIERLIEQFEPKILYGFDPNVSGLQEALAQGGDVQRRAGTDIRVEAKAAWTYDGEVGFRSDGLNSWITDDQNAPTVPCIDLAKFIEEIEDEDMLVLKLDCEGAEYELLKHLMIRNADELIDIAIVEWHTKGIERAEERRRVIEKEIRCEIQEWPY